LSLSLSRQQPRHWRPQAHRDRTHLAHPSLLLLDEVIAGLAPPDARALIELILTIHRQGTMIILIERNMRAVMELAGRIIVLHHGEKIRTGCEFYGAQMFLALATV
jgi:ABC-type branched-subunit amino acid transport system ATPase component